MWPLLAMVLAQGLPPPTEPPIFPSDVPVEAPPEPPKPAPPPDEPTRTTILHFAPVSIFSTHLSFELEKAISNTVAVSASIGASLILQVGSELGLRLYLSERALQGPFLGAQVAGFYFSAAQVLLLGPGLLGGYTFRPKGNLAMSIGGGLQVWFQPTADTGVRVLGVIPQAAVVLLPGFQRPGQGHWAAQPIIRFTVGPAF